MGNTMTHEDNRTDYITLT